MSISRRAFLRTATCAAAGIGAAASRPARAMSAGYMSPRWMGMLTDLSLCIGCRKCEYACNDANGLPNEPLKSFEDKSVFEETRRTSAEKFTVVNRFEPKELDKPVFVKKQCMHCVEPACASACLVKAFTKTEDGPVVYNPDVCIGCRYCMVACPFNIPAYEYNEVLTPRVRKCMMCHSRYAETGEQPACVKICPEEAITFGPREDLLKLARDKMRLHPGRYVDHIFGEREAGGTNWLYISPVPFEELGFPTNIAQKAYPEYTKGFMSTVPLVMATWPMALMGAFTFTKSRMGETEVSGPKKNEEASS